MIIVPVIILEICQSATHACNDEQWTLRQVSSAGCGDPLTCKLVIRWCADWHWSRAACWAVHGLAVESQLTPVATLARHLLAFALPIRGHRVELGGCGSHADQHGLVISGDSGLHPAPQDDRYWAVTQSRRNNLILCNYWQNWLQYCRVPYGISGVQLWHNCTLVDNLSSRNQNTHCT
jgi:hypothetical protein